MDNLLNSDDFQTPLSSPRSCISTPPTSPPSNGSSNPLSARYLERESSPLLSYTARFQNLLVGLPFRIKQSTFTAKSTPTSVIDDIKSRRNNFLRAKRDLILPLLDKVPDVLSDSEYHGQPTIEQQQQLTSQPRGLRATLKPYQLEGLSFLMYLRRNGMGGILGDEMGLGKTLQTLTLFEHVTESERSSCINPAPFLVVCPLSVLDTWITELTKWTPNLTPVKFHGTRDQRVMVKKLFSKKQGKEGCFKEDVRSTVLITCYETLMADILWFRKVAIWKYVVLDEGHRIKDSNSKRAQAMGKLRAEYKLILTGTPIQNNLGEVWSLLHWLFPEVFTPSSAKLFKDAFSLNEGKFDAAFSNHIKGFLNLIMLRRLKDSPQVGINLPPKQVVTLAVPLSKLQHSLYMKVLTGLDEALGEVSRPSSTLETDKEGWPIDRPNIDLNKPAAKRKWKISDNVLMEV